MEIKSVIASGEELIDRAITQLDWSLLITNDFSGLLDDEVKNTETTKTVRTTHIQVIVECTTTPTTADDVDFIIYDTEALNAIPIYWGKASVPVAGDWVAFDFNLDVYHGNDQGWFINCNAGGTNDGEYKVYFYPMVQLIPN